MYYKICIFYNTSEEHNQGDEPNLNPILIFEDLTNPARYFKGNGNTESLFPILLYTSLLVLSMKGKYRHVESKREDNVLI